MSELPAETLERLLAGELSAEEQRRLAQTALDDPDLFDQLTAAAAVASSRDCERTEPAAIPLRRPTPSRVFRRAAIAVAALAAMIVLAIAYRSRSVGPSPLPPESTTARSSPPNAATPSRPAPITVAPILLTAYAGDAASPPTTFRADDTARRLPKAEAPVTSENAGIVEIDLGSLDGVKQGMVLATTRLEAPADDVRHVTITTVFRERSRGRVADGAVRLGDIVHVAPDVHLTALLNQLAASRSTGNTNDVRAIVDSIARDVQETRLPAALRAQALNELGALQIEQRDYDSAERSLQAALPQAGAVTKLQLTNNLGALAALRGDRAAAERWYREARSLAQGAGATAERAAIDRNLDALAPAR